MHSLLVLATSSIKFCVFYLVFVGLVSSILRDHILSEITRLSVINDEGDLEPAYRQASSELTELYRTQLFSKWVSFSVLLSGVLGILGILASSMVNF